MQKKYLIEHSHDMFEKSMHTIMKFYWFRLFDAFKKCKDLFINREEDITIEISFQIISAAELIKAAVSLQIS